MMVSMVLMIVRRVLSISPAGTNLEPEAFYPRV